MESKRLLFQMPMSLLVITLLSNCLGYLAAIIFQSSYLKMNAQALTDYAMDSETSFDLAYGASSLIASVALPFSIVLVLVISFFSTKIIKEHLYISAVLSFLFGVIFISSVYWGVPVLSYVFVTGVITPLLIMWRQKHLTKRLNQTAAAQPPFS